MDSDIAPGVTLTTVQSRCIGNLKAPLEVIISVQLTKAPSPSSEPTAGRLAEWLRLNIMPLDKEHIFLCQLFDQDEYALNDSLGALDQGDTVWKV